MKTKSICFKSCFAIVFFLFAANSGIAQQQSPPDKAEVVIYKFAKSDYELNGKAVQQSISQVTGVTLNKFCDAFNKTFMILHVDRAIQPNDDNIVVAMNAAKIGFKKIKTNEIPTIIDACP